MSGRYRSTVVWGTICTFLAGALVVNLSNDASLSKVALAGPTVGKGPALSYNWEQQTVDQPPASLMTDITARPLFTAERRLASVTKEEPLPATSTSESEKKSEPPVLELAGTLLTRASGVALVIDESAAPHRIRVGEVMENWTVDMVARDRVRLVKDGQAKRTMLRADDPAARLLPDGR